MNNQPLPKPSQVKKDVNQNKSGGSTPPPSALNASKAIAEPGKIVVPPKSVKPSTTDTSKKAVVFDGKNAKSRIPLAQKATPGTRPVGTASGVKLPPTSLSALSSMSSNAIPKTTVLGAPIPQVIRGEKLPQSSGAAPSANLKTPKTPLSNSTAPALKVGQKKTSPVPVAPVSNIKKGSEGDIKKSGGLKPVKEKKSIFKFLPFIVGGVVILAILGFIASRIFSGGKTTSISDQKSDSTSNAAGSAVAPAKRTEVPSEQKEIIYWGLWEPSEVLSEIITDFEFNNPGIKITYIKQSHKDYRERLQSALESGSGPDVFRFHASWVPMLESDLFPIPSSVVSVKDFQDNYYPIVTDQLVSSGQYVGVPLMYDGLALYYNQDILESANETAPSTWAELRLLASKLTVKSANGIERAGLAIGNTENVDHFSDILAVLMLQNGADFNDPNSQETRDALLFYTNFVLKDEVWNEKLPSSTVAFARGDVAMMFAPSWRAHEVSAQNPDLRFKTMTLPQLSDERIAWGSYWAEGISASGENKEIAAEFVGFLSSEENLKKMFSKASEIRAFGEIYPKASMAQELIDNEIVSSYLDDAIYAQNWYLNSFTHDNGINDQMIEYYKDGINAVLLGEDIEDVLLTIEAGTKQVLKQYGVSTK